MMLEFKSFTLIMREICNGNDNDDRARLYRFSTFFLQVSNKSSTFASLFIIQKYGIQFIKR